MGTKALSNLDFDSVLKVINLADGTNPGDAINKSQLDANATADRSRANHTGTQTASTISNFDTQVRTSRLDQMTAPTGAVSLNSQQITSLADGTSSGHAVNKGQLDAAVSALASGQVTKGAVRAASDANVTIATPGVLIDGRTPANGEVFLLAGQTDPTENGPYVFNGAATAMTRAPNWDTDAEAALGSYWIVREGTHADSFALLTNDTAITLGTSSPAFVFIGVSAGAGVTGYTETSPSVSAGGTWTVTHGLGTRSLLAQVFREGSPYDAVSVAITRATTNTITVLPDVAMSSGEYRVVISKPSF